MSGGTRKRPEPVQVVKSRRDGALAWLVGGIPYVQFLGIAFDRRGDELTAVLPYDDKLIGNPAIPALHGGVTAAFLEVTAIVSLAWATLWEEFESGRIDPAEVAGKALPPPAAHHRLYRRLPALGPAARCLCAGADSAVGPPLCQRHGGGLAGQPRPALRAGLGPSADAARAGAARRMSQITHARVLRIAAPVVLSNATVPLLGAVDTAVVGQMGLAAPIGAVGLGAMILATFYWVFGFLRMSTSGLAAQAHGAGDGVERSAILLRALMVAGAAGLGLIVLQSLLFGAAFAIAPANATRRCPY